MADVASVVHNPAFSDGEAQQASPLDIELALADGSLSAEEGLAEMARQLRQIRAEVDARLPRDGSPFEHAVRSAIARIAEAPPNLHQYVAHIASSADEQDAEMKRWLPLAVLGSAALVLMQCMVTSGLYSAAIIPPCATSAQCEAPTYCQVGGNGRCGYCGESHPFPEQLDPTNGETLNLRTYDQDFAGFNATLVRHVCENPDQWPADVPTEWATDDPTIRALRVRSWCETCVHPIDGTVDVTNSMQQMRLNLLAMGVYDYVALVLASFIIALAVVGEIKDVFLCGLTISAYHEKIAPGYRVVLSLLGAMRRWLFLPQLAATVPQLVLLKGGDALSISFNTVAVLFLTEIDTVVYSIGLSEHVKSRFERKGTTRQLPHGHTPDLS